MIAFRVYFDYSLYMTDYDYIIVGASQAGLTGARTLREIHRDSSILIINGEDRLPYKRTHLTKNLARGFEKDEFALFDETWYKKNHIDRVDSTAVKLDTLNRSIQTQKGVAFSWGKLLLATGAVPKRQEIPGSSEFLHLRQAHETEEMRNKLLKAHHVVIVGQGVEGIEMAEQCRLLGLSVTSTSTSERLMSRWLDEELSIRLERLLISQGIVLRHKERPTELKREKKGFTLSVDGVGGIERLFCDYALTSVGIVGETSLLKPLMIDDLLGERGIRCDIHMQTVIKDVYAAGDVVQLPSGWANGLWHSAEMMGKTAATNMAGIVLAHTNWPIRLKCEVFGDFFFSMAYDRILKEADLLANEIFINTESQYLRVFFKEGKAIGALMQGMKTQAKDLVKLVEKGAKKEDFLTLT